MKFKPFDEEEKQLLLKMHEISKTGVTGRELYARFTGNPVFDNIVGLRGRKAVQNALTNLRAGRANYAPKATFQAAAVAVEDEAPKKRIGRPPGKKDKKPRRTIVRAAAWKSVETVKKFKRKYRIKRRVAAAANHTHEPSPVPVPVAAPYQMNRCPHCGCPLHGAQEGLRTEQELRGGA